MNKKNERGRELNGNKVIKLDLRHSAPVQFRPASSISGSSASGPLRRAPRSRVSISMAVPCAAPAPLPRARLPAADGPVGIWARGRLPAEPAAVAASMGD